MSDGRWVYGAGGHGRVVRDVLEAAGLAVDGFLDDGLHGVVDGLPIVGGRAWVEDALASRRSPLVFLGIGVNRVRRLVGERLASQGVALGIAVHPRAWVSPRATIEDGAVVFAGATVNAGARIGRGAIVNTGAVVEHDCVLGPWSHVSPGAVLGGEATVGEGAWVGIGAVVLPRIAVGAGAILGGGGVAVRDVADGAVVVGVPARSRA